MRGARAVSCGRSSLFRLRRIPHRHTAFTRAGMGRPGFPGGRDIECRKRVGCRKKCVEGIYCRNTSRLIVGANQRGGDVGHVTVSYISCTMWVGGSSESSHAVEVEDWVVNPVAPIKRGYQCGNRDRRLTSARARRGRRLRPMRKISMRKQEWQRGSEGRRLLGLEERGPRVVERYRSGGAVRVLELLNTGLELGDGLFKHLGACSTLAISVFAII